MSTIFRNRMVDFESASGVPYVGIDMEDFENNDPSWLKEKINASIKFQCNVCSGKLTTTTVNPSYKEKRDLLLKHVNSHISVFRPVKLEDFKHFTPEPYKIPRQVAPWK